MDSEENHFAKWGGGCDENCSSKTWQNFSLQKKERQDKTERSLAMKFEVGEEYKRFRESKKITHVSVEKRIERFVAAPKVKKFCK